jgi:hypothetical protein
MYHIQDYLKYTFAERYNCQSITDKNLTIYKKLKPGLHPILSLNKISKNKW